jgi:hypothetical protein
MYDLKFIYLNQLKLRSHIFFWECGNETMDLIYEKNVFTSWVNVVTFQKDPVSCSQFV